MYPAALAASFLTYLPTQGLLGGGNGKGGANGRPGRAGESGTRSYLISGRPWETAELDNVTLSPGDMVVDISRGGACYVYQGTVVTRARTRGGGGGDGSSSSRSARADWSHITTLAAPIVSESRPFLFKEAGTERTLVGLSPAQGLHLDRLPVHISRRAEESMGGDTVELSQVGNVLSFKDTSANSTVLLALEAAGGGATQVGTLRATEQLAAPGVTASLSEGVRVSLPLLLEDSMAITIEDAATPATPAVILRAGELSMGGDKVRLDPDRGALHLSGALRVGSDAILSVTPTSGLEMPNGAATLSTSGSFRTRGSVRVSGDLVVEGNTVVLPAVDEGVTASRITLPSHPATSRASLLFRRSHGALAAPHVYRLHRLSQDGNTLRVSVVTAHLQLPPVGLMQVRVFLRPAGAEESLNVMVVKAVEEVSADVHLTLQTLGWTLGGGASAESITGFFLVGADPVVDLSWWAPDVRASALDLPLPSWMRSPASFPMVNLAMALHEEPADSTTGGPAAVHYGNVARGRSADGSAKLSHAWPFSGTTRSGWITLFPNAHAALDWDGIYDTFALRFRIADSVSRFAPLRVGWLQVTADDGGSVFRVDAASRVTALRGRLNLESLEISVNYIIIHRHFEVRGVGPEGRPVLELIDGVGTLVRGNLRVEARAEAEQSLPVFSVEHPGSEEVAYVTVRAGQFRVFDKLSATGVLLASAVGAGAEACLEVGTLSVAADGLEVQETLTVQAPTAGAAVRLDGREGVQAPFVVEGDGGESRVVVTADGVVHLRSGTAVLLGGEGGDSSLVSASATDGMTIRRPGGGQPAVRIAAAATALGGQGLLSLPHLSLGGSAETPTVEADQTAHFLRGLTSVAGGTGDRLVVSDVQGVCLSDAAEQRRLTLREGGLTVTAPATLGGPTHTSGGCLRAATLDVRRIVLGTIAESAVGEDATRTHSTTVLFAGGGFEYRSGTLAISGTSTATNFQVSSSKEYLTIPFAGIEGRARHSRLLRKSTRRPGEHPIVFQVRRGGTVLTLEAHYAFFWPTRWGHPARLCLHIKRDVRDWGAWFTFSSGPLQDTTLTFGILDSAYANLDSHDAFFYCDPSFGGSTTQLSVLLYDQDSGDLLPVAARDTLFAACNARGLVVDILSGANGSGGSSYEVLPGSFSSAALNYDQDRLTVTWATTPEWRSAWQAGLQPGAHPVVRVTFPDTTIVAPIPRSTRAAPPPSVSTEQEPEEEAWGVADLEPAALPAGSTLWLAEAAGPACVQCHWHRTGKFLRLCLSTPSAAADAPEASAPRELECIDEATQRQVPLRELALRGLPAAAARGIRSATGVLCVSSSRGAVALRWEVVGSTGALSLSRLIGEGGPDESLLPIHLDGCIITCCERID